MRRAIDRYRDHQLLLIVGLDGVIVDYEPNPESVRLSPSNRDLLVALHARRDTTLGIISGRRIDDIRARADLGAHVFYIGLHGLEVEGPGIRRDAPRKVDRIP